MEEIHMTVTGKTIKRPVTKQTTIKAHRLLANVAAASVMFVIGYGMHQPKEVEVKVPEPYPVYVDRRIEVPAEPEIQVMYVPVASDAENRKHFALTNEERDLIERVVIQEVGWGHLEDMIGVAQCIRDKAEHPNTELYYGPDIKNVLAHGHATPFVGEPVGCNTDMVALAVSLVFDEGVRLFGDEKICIYFYEPESDPAIVAQLRQYEYVGSTTYCEFRSDKLIE